MPRSATAVLWPAKLGLKIVLGATGIPYRGWARLGINRHGQMDQASCAHAVTCSYLAPLTESGRMKGAAIVEIGPGDGLLSAVVARVLEPNGPG